MKSYLLTIGAILVASISAINLNKHGHDTMGAGGAQSQTKDATFDGPCVEALNLTVPQMEKEMEYFSRNFDIKHFQNALEIQKNLSVNGVPTAKAFVHTWELYDKSFSFPRVRRYDFV